MTMNDIRRIYTQKVAELLAQGYQINPETMNGSQGEMAHIDLTNGAEILRVLIETCGSYGESYGDILTIRVGRCNDEIRGRWLTIWNSWLDTTTYTKPTTTRITHSSHSIGSALFISRNTSQARNAPTASITNHTGVAVFKFLKNALKKVVIPASSFSAHSRPQVNSAALAAPMVTIGTPQRI